MAKRSKAKGGSRRREAEVAIPAGLTPAQYEFCLVYLSNGYKAAPAYRATHPKASEATSRTEGWRILTNPHVKAYLRTQLADRWEPYQMDAAEATARVALDARADLRLLYDAKGDLLPPHQWPDDVANSVEALEHKADGSIKVKLVSKLGARRLVLELTGKLRDPGDGLRDLAEILAEKWKGEDDGQRQAEDGPRAGSRGTAAAARRQR